MKICQISDLHLSKTNEHIFIERWSRASTWLKGPFDFVVVSGDIANRATPEDYEVALTHLGDLIKMVKDRDRARVIIVPGNHDVSWKPPVGRQMTADEIKGERELLEHLLDKGPSEPAVYNRRFETSLDGATKVWAINASDYAARFAPFGDFLERFYDPPLTKPHQSFNIRAHESRWHWSAHVFPTENIAFYGLSSCLITDKHSPRSAALCEDALVEIEKHAAVHAKTLRKVAVWHHGMVSPRGRADNVTRSELTNLGLKEFTLGLHGHTHHEERARLGGGYHDDLLVLGTGSFSAEPSALATGACNQFSIIEVENHDETKWTVYDFKESDGGWAPRPTERFVPRRHAQAWPVSPGGNLITTHTRTITVDKDGIATVQAKLEGLSLRDKLTIGTPSPGFTDIRWNSHCKVHAPNHTGKVEVIVEPEGHKQNRPLEVRRQRPHRFVASVKKPVDIATLEWSYSISNGFALDEVDAVTGRYPGREALALLHTDAAVDGFVYCVEDHTTHLTLVLELPEASEIAEPTIVAERARPSSSEVRWDYDLDDESRVALTQKAKNQLEITVEKPRTGNRYGVKYHLRGGKTPVPDRYRECVDEVVDACRHATPSRAPVLTSAIAAVLRNAFRLPDVKFWTAHLWDSRIKKLVVCFGEFSFEHWSSSFGAGQGIAGHALRMCEATVYRARADAPKPTDKRSLLYLPRDEGHPAHQVVIELPILIDRDHAVGTIGFSVRPGDGQGTHARDLFTRIAEDVTFPPGDVVARNRRLLDEITKQASRAFWKEISRTHLNVATEVLQNLRRKRSKG